MNTVLLRAGNILGQLFVSTLAAREMALLLILAASLLVFRTFRERYLMVWIAGWIVYFVSRRSLASHGTYAVPASQAEFILAVSLFVAGALIYSNARFLVAPLSGISVGLIAFSVSRSLLWPGSVPLHFALELAYHLLTVGAAILVLRFGRARREIGPWILACGLLSLRMSAWPANFHLPLGAEIFSDLVLGLGILLVVHDESRLHIRRLAALNALTAGIAQVGQDGVIAETALQELKQLMSAKAAWFRLVQGHSLKIHQQSGLSAAFMNGKSIVSLNDPAERIPEQLRPTKVSGEALDDAFRRENIKQILVVGVPGRKAPVGCLILGNRRKKSYAPDELDFLTSCARQFGLALENLHLVEEILRSHRQWSNTFESIQDLVLLHDADYRILKANPSLLGRIGKSQAEIVGQLCEAVLPNDGTAWKNCPYCHGGDEGFHEGADPFGGYSVASTSSYIDQGTKQQATIHVVRDVTERHAAEQKYRSLFEQVQEGVFVTTTAGQLLDCNDAFVRMLGYPNRDSLLGRNLDSEFYISQEQRATFRREIEMHNFIRDFEVNLRRKDGSSLIAVESSFAIRDDDGRVERYQGFLLDVTAKKHAEDEIRRRNRELNALNAMAVIATQSFDLDEILNLTLRQVISLLGAEAGSVYLAEPENHFRRRASWGQRVTDRQRLSDVHFPENLGELVTRSRAEVLTAEYVPHLPQAVTEFIAAANGGSSIWVVLWGKDNPIGLMGIGRNPTHEYSSNDENLLVAIGRQLSTTVEKVRLYEETCKAYDDLRRAQEQLLQSEKMSAVGQLIAGVAHELNNPLTAILGYAQLLETESLEPKVMEYVNKIFKQGQRTHRVVQNLLSFARQRKPQKEQFDVIRVLEEALLLRDYDMKVGNIRLQRDFQSNVPAVLGDPHQLEQVFLNIINNSIDAMTGEVSTESVKPEHHFRVRVAEADGSISVEFHDSGPGIQEPSRIFEPFYTTKNVGKGTGLGLSICYGIVKEHGGEISARNGEQAGAVILVKLPSAGRPAASSPAQEPRRREAALSGTILLVEDEEIVMEFERDVLAGAGARVVTAMSAEEMKSLLAERTFDALVLNGKMPGAPSVQETREWLSKTYPELRGHFLFTFSNLADAEVRSFLEQNGVPFLVKPFEVGDLISNARRLVVKAQHASAGK